MTPRRPPGAGQPDGDPGQLAESLDFANHMQEVVARFDPRLRHVFVNKVIQRITGLAPEAFVGKTNRELGMPEDLVAQWDEALHGVFRSGVASEVSFSYAGLDRVHQITSALLPEKDATGQVRSVLSIGRDTTELAELRAQLKEQLQQQAQQQAQQSVQPKVQPAVPLSSPGLAALEPALREGHFRAMVESSDDAIISKTLDGLVTSWNTGAQRMFGYTEAEMLGKPMLRLFPNGRRDEEVFILERLAEGERVDHFETVRVCKDGHLVDVSVSLSPIFDAAGRVVGASKIARDISLQKRQQQRLQMVLDATGDGLWDWDLRTGRVFRTAQYYALIGSSEDTEDFEFFKRSIHPDDLGRVLQTIEAHLRGASDRLEFAFRLHTAPGVPVKWLQTRGRVTERDAYGNPVRMLGTLSEISASRPAGAAADDSPP
jgi:PAS domain S-box-containing protein